MDVAEGDGVGDFAAVEGVEQIAEEKEEGDHGGERVAQLVGLRQKRHFHRPLKLAVDGGEESHYEVDQREHHERTQRIFLFV